MKIPTTVAASLALAALIAACSGNGLDIEDGSGQPVQIGGDTASVGGPGSAGWPEPSGPVRTR